MSEEKNIPEEELTTGKRQMTNEYFPEDSHAPQPQTITNTPEKEKMEVHKHPHHITHKKKWPEYFLEFLMLFLAVFLGFLAENQREHMVEHQRAEQYALSLLRDLQSDTASLKTAISYGNQKVVGIDSLIEQIDQRPEKWNARLIYTYQGYAGRIRPFRHNSGTYEQIKASGSLRYFKQKLTDLLNQYDVQAKKSAAREDIHVNYASNLLNPFILHIVDIRAVIEIQDGKTPTHPLVFRKVDQETIALWINYAAVTQSTMERTVVEYDAMLKQAKEIINALRKEYHLE